MVTEAMLQLGILILTLSLFFIMHNIRNQITRPTNRTRTRNNNRQPDPNRHLAQASRHLARARSTSHRAHHAKTALMETDRALSVWPRDPWAHILRAQALQLMGHRAAAIKSLDAALSSPAAKSLSAAERAGALVRRAELKVGVNRRRRVDSGIEDLVEAVGLSGNDSEALCLLGKCYEWKGMKSEAEDAFQKVLEIDPDSEEARTGLDRLRLLSDQKL
ncbi:uncharacterized protein LOC109801478 [Cajanus cajan]|uniref:Uncharacterized protein n=1 Tax=Cajanus cajan TaxID=3821 RepID=A0A151TGS0_CAJCA|nr:uncharacterized protein LOC109801478 [Cajanus cajan]KYP66247.1 hypothetical protein KK1_012534 [Cajanus cajan]